ncbi:MAG: amino acid ABC transporter substrate-binding protein [Rhodomicrobium sp.]
MRKKLLIAGAFVASAMAVANSQAQEAAGLSPALQNIKSNHKVRLGYRESSIPFSFLDEAKRPIGYSLELCEAIVEQIGKEVDDPSLGVEYVKATSESRIQAILDDRIDLECGSTTANAERTKRVAFSPVIFIAGTRLMVLRTSAVRDISDLRGKSIAVTKGTTNEQAIIAADSKLGLALRIEQGQDHEQSYQMLASGKVDAFATDDILLYGLIARHRAQDRFRVTGDLLSYEPYGIMFRKGDQQLADVVERTFRELGANHDLVPIYHKWFVSRLPTGEKLGVPIAPELEQIFNVLDSTQGSTD